MSKGTKGAIPLSKVRAMGDAAATGPSGGGAKPAPMKGAAKKPMPFKRGGKAC